MAHSSEQLLDEKFTSVMHMFDALNSDLVSSIVRNWLKVSDMCKLDSALSCGGAHRDELLTLFSFTHTLLYGLDGNKSVNIMKYLHWLAIRKVKVEKKWTPAILDNYISKCIPISKLVTGSENKRIGADSIHELFNVMNVRSTLPVRFLDALCRNSVLLMHLKFTFPTIEVGSYEQSHFYFSLCITI